MDDPVDPWFAPEPRTIWTGLKAFYQYWLPPLVAASSLLWLLCVFFFKPARPPVGVYIAALAGLAVVVTVWSPESNWSKAAWLAVFFALSGLEIATLYQERSENQRQQADARKEEKDAFQTIADGLTTSIRNNQLAFDATMRSMRGLTQLTRQNSDEATGGRSFCYIEIRSVGGLPGRLATMALLGKGKDPLSAVSIRIVDIDEMNRAIAAKKPLAESLKFDRYFYFAERSRYTGLFKQLERFEPEQDSKSFNIFMRALNGVFTERLRLRFVNRVWMNAARVDASYYDNASGVVLEEVDKGFPADVLRDDRDWHAVDQLRKLSVPDK